MNGNVGIMTTNHVESRNKAILDARKLSVISLIRDLFPETVEYFDQSRVEIALQSLKGQIFTKYINKLLSQLTKRAIGHSVKLFD